MLMWRGKFVRALRSPFKAATAVLEGSLKRKSICILPEAQSYEESFSDLCHRGSTGG